MAGGSGTRLWPASSSNMPKQFLSATFSANDKEDKSFFSLALERALSAGERVIVITGKSHIPHVIADAAKLTATEKKRIIVIGEPIAKNTAPAIACAAFFSGTGNMLVLTSDHIIKPLEKFISDAGRAEKTANNGKLVIFGIPPSRPETGYGYIESVPQKQNSIKTKNVKARVLDVAAFHEKPDLENAVRYIKNGNFFWNSGMFAFDVKFITDQFNFLASDVIKPFLKLKKPDRTDYIVSKNIKILNNWKGLENAYKKTKNISFDYAVAEKCGNRAMIRASFDWIDIGNWDEYIKLTGRKKSLVFNAGSDTCYVDSDIPVALAGVDDLIVIIRSEKDGRPAAALITKKGQTQKVRDVTEIIKNSGNNYLL